MSPHTTIDIDVILGINLLSLRNTPKKKPTTHIEKLTLFSFDILKEMQRA